VLPSVLGATHPTHKSPHVASILQSVLAAVWVGLFAYFLGTNDPNAQAYATVYTMLAILGTMLLLILQAVVSIAIIRYFRANHPGEVNIFASLIAPVIAFLSQVYLVYLLVDNLETFGATGSFGTKIPTIAFTILAIGLAWGLVLRFVSPKAHARIGRLVLNDD
jgi:amino acid transporter